MIKRKPVRAAENGGIGIDIALGGFAARTDGVDPRSNSMDPEVVAYYLADMIAQLEGLARATNNDMLAYLLSMASVQAAAPKSRWERSNALH